MAYCRYSLVENKETCEVLSSLPEAARSCGLLVAGAGAAGIYAASAAAERGADVTLLERDLGIGGMHVLGSVLGYYYGDEGGAYERDDEDCLRETAFYAVGLFPEVKQSREIRRLQRAGVTLLTRHTPVAVYADEKGTVVGLDVFDGEKVAFFAAKLVVDATSDGHLIRMLPVKKQIGRAFDGKTVPFTVRRQFIADGVYRSVNRDSGFVDVYDAFAFSDKVRLAHASAIEYLPRGEFLSLASHAGVREGLTYEGEETLSYADLLYDRKPEKTLFYAYSDLDKHGYDLALDEELFRNWFFLCNLATVTLRIPVPFGSVVPQGFSGIVTAGRCLSCDRYVQSAVRMNRDMFRMGECVGVAAAMALESGKTFSEIDYDAYLAAVRARGCHDGLPGRERGFGYPKKDVPFAPVDFDFDRALPLLATNAPGPALWASYLKKGDREAADVLYAQMTGGDTQALRENSAIALGLAGDRRALPLLRQIAESRSPHYYTSCRRSNPFPSTIALCLLGELGGREDTALPEQIVFDRGEIERPVYHVLEKKNRLYDKEGDRNFLYFYHFTFAAVALVTLYRRHGLPMAQLHERFQALFSDDAVVRRVTDGAPDSPAYTEFIDFEKQLLAMTG